MVVHAGFEGRPVEVGEVLEVVKVLGAILHVVFDGLLDELFGTSLRVQVAAVGGSQRNGTELYFVIVVLRGVQATGAGRFYVVRGHHSSATVEDHQVPVVRAFIFLGNPLIARRRCPLGRSCRPLLHLHAQLELVSVGALRPPWLLLPQRDLLLRVQLFL